ncbi:alpha-L-rhamnosidase C-terminal domain-containing protein [Cohnella fermenti]|uniref:Alpha-L-rhamnosidase n=1 Tax=Cohnella fermenti TaxID=2565925 RepID=A0A4S4C049_9BACL|nr:alpha-L-rhamnosidase C-terminal domain-containing protein [Cohnella fermenti]THF80292.1 alpha-L-rhamnosidase [Cohnella fermenti]
MMVVTSAIPKWIWHEDGASRLQHVLSRELHLDRGEEKVRLFVAATGHVEIVWDGVVVGQLEEHPAHLASFIRIDAFPDSIAAGRHRLELRISCTEPMPIVDVNVHLQERRVGCIGYLEGAELWLPTDERWDSAGASARVVCLLGEEPYGDLENGPDWFVRGGYGDIGTKPLTDYGIVERSGIEAIGRTNGVLSLSGTHTVQAELPSVRRNERHIFYHLRKQQEWAELRAYQERAGLGEAPWIVLEMDAEYNMRFRVHNDSGRRATILWNGAESLTELERYAGCITESFPVDPGGSFTILPQGMRYVRFCLIGLPGEAFDLRIRFEEVGVMLEQIGQFGSDHPVADRIYHTSVHTNRICHQTGLWDGVKRDRLNWTYDFYMAAKADYVLWNDFSVLKRTILELGHTPYGYWMNSIPAYTCWWMVNVWDYYLHTGDRAFVLEIKPALERHLRWIVHHIDPETGMFVQRHQAFIEWVPMTEEDAWHTLHAVLAIALSSVNRLNEEIPELGLAASGIKRPTIPSAAFRSSPSLITLMLGAESGCLDEEQERSVLSGIAVSDPVTPLSAFWLAERLAATGKTEEGWAVIERVWGRMLEEGATSFWESVTLAPSADFHHSLTTYTAYESYRISLCHSWSSTPVQWMSRYILGVKPLAPGFAKIAFQPRAMPGMNRCEGTVSTPRGPIRVRWEKREDGRLAASIEAPQGVEIEYGSMGERILLR